MSNLALSDQQQAYINQFKLKRFIFPRQEYLRISRVISLSKLFKNDIRIACFGESIPVNIFLNHDSTVNNAALVDLYFSGATIILQSVNRYSDEIELLRRGLETVLNKEVHVNAYLTPPHSDGLGYHTDEYDVFLYQLYGNKMWETRVDPLGNGEISIIAEGSWGFVPCGLKHTTKTLAKPSMHLTFGCGSDGGIDESHNRKVQEGTTSIEVYNDLVSSQYLENHFQEIIKLVNLTDFFSRNMTFEPSYPELYAFVREKSAEDIEEFIESDCLSKDLALSILKLLIRIDPDTVKETLSVLKVA